MGQFVARHILKSIENRFVYTDVANYNIGDDLLPATILGSIENGVKNKMFIVTGGTICYQIYLKIY